MPAYDFPLLIKHLLGSRLAQKTPKEIVYRDVLRYSYPEFHERIARLGSALSRLGVRPGDTVAVMDWDSHRYLECYFAVPMLGAVLQTVNVRLSPEQILYCLNHARAKTIVCNVAFLPIFETIRDQLTTLEKTIWISEAAPIPTHLGGHGEYEEFVSSGDPNREFPDFDENTRATIFYTTGTTGAPKGVAFSHRQLVLHTLAELVASRLTREDVYMPLTPMFHVHGWGFPYTATLAGCKQVYPGQYAPDLLLRLIVQEKVTFSHCVPTILQMLLWAPGARDIDFYGLRMIIGGSAMPRALCAEAVKRGIDVWTAYGMSETCPLLTCSSWHPQPSSGADDIEARLKAGFPVPLVDVRVVDEQMNDVPHDGLAQGEVVARAPWLTQTYHDNEEATQALWAGGYLHTQDVGVITPGGSLQITDRIKDVIKTGGEWVSSIEVESIISHHPAVAEVAVIGLPDEKWGERPAAIVMPRAGATLQPSDIREQVLRQAERGVVSKYAVPDIVHFVDELPKTSVGKLDKKRMREMWVHD